jgi:integrase
MGSWKTAWKAARKLAGRTLAGKPEDVEGEQLAVHTHDLRHTAITRMLNAGVPLPKVAKIVGWSPRTMVKMAARYGHFTTDDLRSAVEAISSSQRESSTGSRYFPRNRRSNRRAKILSCCNNWLLR